MKTTPEPSERRVTNWQKVERTAEAYERAYALTGVSNPSAFCPDPSDADYLPILCELLRADLEFAWSAGEQKRVESYRSAFPLLFNHPAMLEQVAYEEYRQRLTFHDPVSLSEYPRRFPIDITNWSINRSAPIAMEASLWENPPAALSEIRAVPVGLRYPEVGEAFAEFRLLRELGRGTFARVFLAEQCDLAKRRIVLKISSQLSQESQTLAQLQHTNIVPIYSFHTVGAYSALCMPYFGATTLHDILASHPSQPPSGREYVQTLCRRKDPTWTGTTVSPSIQPLKRQPHIQSVLDDVSHMTHNDIGLWIGAELADGLAHAHDRGILHRDIKPANILIADDGRPMLLDFNLAGQFTPAALLPSSIGGTPMYMSPEQLANMVGQPSPLDNRSDIYALGLVLYEFLAGQPPYPAPEGNLNSRLNTLYQQRKSDIPSAILRNALVSPASAAIILKCLAPHPADRYLSAHQLRDELRRQLHSQPLLHTIEPSFQERCRKFTNRNPWMRSLPVGGVAAGVLLTITGTAISYGIDQQRHVMAEQVYHEHLREIAALRLGLTVPDPDVIEQRMMGAKADLALARYPIPEGEAWEQQSLVRYLNPEKQQRLRNDLTELLLQSSAWEAKQSIALGTARAEQARQLAPTVELRWLATEELARRLEQAGRTQEASATRRENGDTPLSLDWRYRIQDAVRASDYLKALSILEGVPRSGRHDSQYWYALGRTHAALQQWRDALACYDTTLALQSQDTHLILVYRAQAYLATGQHRQALADYDAAIQQQPDDPRNFVDRALTKLALHQLPNALDDLTTAELLWPEHTRICFIRSQIYQQMGQREAARLTREEGLRREPQDEVSWLARGVAKLGTDPSGAIDDFEQALACNPHSLAARQNMAHALAKGLHRTREAIEVLDALLKRQPQYAPALAARGVYHARLGQRDAAHQDAKTVLSMDPSPMMFYQVAGIYALTSQTHPDDAQEAYHLLSIALQEKTGLEYIATDPDLEPIRGYRQFRRIVEAANLLRDTAKRQP